MCLNIVYRHRVESRVHGVLTACWFPLPSDIAKDVLSKVYDVACREAVALGSSV
jgi:hypothetical protein